MDSETLDSRIESLRNGVQSLMPDLDKACNESAEVLVLHQDAFGADYQDGEYTLLGMAVKYAGLFGKEVRIIGTNRETLPSYEKELLEKNLADVMARMDSLVAERFMLEKLLETQVSEKRKHDAAKTRTMVIVNNREIRTAKARIGALQNKLEKMNGI